MDGRRWFMYKASVNSEGGHRLPAVRTHCHVTSPCSACLGLSLKDTTRPRKSHEKEGVEYHFVSKQAFEAGIHHNRYVCWVRQRALGAGAGLRICPVFHLTPRRASREGGGGERIVVEVRPCFCANLGELGNRRPFLLWCFRFLEHGEFKENLYGTSLDAIHAVMAKNKVCLVDVEPDVSSWASWACFLRGIYKLEDCTFHSISDLRLREFY